MCFTSAWCSYWKPTICKMKFMGDALQQSSGCRVLVTNAMCIEDEGHDHAMQCIYEYGDHGGLLLLASHETEGPAERLQFSLDQGACWHNILLAEAIDIQNIRRAACPSFIRLHSCKVFCIVQPMECMQASGALISAFHMQEQATLLQLHLS